ncbi:MAG: hypothetical protein KDI19_00750 [Pseudomonadales bacterium]|nr:hypothetical protein [Pseudomonadales bacterium]
MKRIERILVAVAVVAFLYAIAGNYIALPGYLRFLERGGTSAAGNHMDMAVVLGAMRTILWMYAFNLGAMALYFLDLRRLDRRYLRIGMAIAAIWIAFWSLPSLPRMPAAFYITAGSAVLLAIFAVHVGGGNHRPERARFLFSTAVLFLAMATWEVCGLGSTGRILHPEQVVLERSQTLLATQTTKLMLAFLIGWGCLAASLRGGTIVGNFSPH